MAIFHNGAELWNFEVAGYRGECNRSLKSKPDKPVVLAEQDLDTDLYIFLLFVAY